MAKTARTVTTRPDDRAALQQEIESLRRENAELKEKLAKGPVDTTWFTPGLMALLALGLFFAVWAKYAPTGRRRVTPASEVSATSDYNPPPTPAPTPAPSR